MYIIPFLIKAFAVVSKCSSGNLSAISSAVNTSIGTPNLSYNIVAKFFNIFLVTRA